MKPIKFLPLVFVIWQLLPFISINPEKTVESAERSSEMVISMTCKSNLVVFYDINQNGATVYPQDLYLNPATTTCTSSSTITYFIASTETGPRSKDSITLGINDLFIQNCLWLTARDACGDETTCKVNVDFIDTIPPVIRCPNIPSTNLCELSSVPTPHLNLADFVSAGGFVFDETFTSQNQASAYFGRFPDSIARVGCLKKVFRKYRINDVLGNRSTCTQIFNVSDTIAIKCPKDSIVLTATDVCYGIYRPILDFNVNCDMDTVFHNGTTTNRYDVGIRNITFTAATNCKDTARCTFRLTVQDKQRPDVTCPSNVTIPVCVALPAAATFNNFIAAGGTASDNCSNLSTVVTSTDAITGTACPRTLTRTYTVSDASNNTATCQQTIMLGETVKPTITPPANITLNTSSNACTATITNPLTLPIVSDNCTPTASLVRTRNPSGNTFTHGPNMITWMVTDLCGNTNTATSTVTVVDNVAPGLTCKGPRELSLSTNNTTLVPDTLISLITDNCHGPFTKTISRMTTTCSPTATQFGPSVSFCCADANTTVQVIVRVTDNSNNTSTCMVNVSVKDKLAPTMTERLRDFTVSCDYNLQLNNLSAFGTYVLRQADRKVLTVNDPLFIASPGPKLDGLFEDFCNASVTQRPVIDQRNIHNTGNIIRTFVVTDASGNSTTATQKITVVDSDLLKLSDITWPQPYTYSDCKITPPTPSISGRPTFNADDICTVPAATFKDQVFDDPTSGCLYIRRKWTVIDWAQYTPNGTIGIWTHIQDIHLVNSVKPVFSAATCRARTICATNANCDVRIALGADATDDCTDVKDLIYDYVMDINSNGTIDSIGKTDTLNFIVPRGNHTVTWRVEDRCGNRETCTFTVQAKECKAPTPICLFGLSTNLENDATATIWAKDFNNYSNDNCTKEADLKFSFSTNVNDTNKTLTCSNRGNFPIAMWVTDNDGNQSKCNTFISVTDNKKLCPTLINDNNTVTIAGRVSTEEEAMIKDVQMNITSEGVTKEVMTDNEGNYLMSNLDEKKDYTISPLLNKNWTEGVSTLDMVLIQRHVLGVAKLNSPYKMIAADVNNDEKITASDLVMLRKLILGVESQVPNNTSWRFANKSYVFADPNNPWPFEGNLFYNSLEENMMSADFYAIKVGDINGTVSSNLKSKVADNRTQNNEDITLEDIAFEEGKYVNVPVNSTSELSLNALQLSMIINKDALQFVGIMGEGVYLNDEDYYYNPNTGEIRIAYINQKGINVKSGATLFTLQLKAKSSNKISNVLETTAFPSFMTNKNDEVSNLTLRFNDSSEPLVVKQNVPNPFDNFTDVSYTIGEESKVEFTIYNASGMVIHNSVSNSKAGQNTLRIDKQQLGSEVGVFYLHIATGERREIRKLLRLN